MNYFRLIFLLGLILLGSCKSRKPESPTYASPLPQPSPGQVTDTPGWDSESRHDPRVPGCPVLVADDLQDKLLPLINEIRQAGCDCGNQKMPPVPPLTWNKKLVEAAVRHSIDMASKDNLSHTGSDGSSFGDRITDAGFTWSAAAENASHGQRSAAKAVQAWTLSKTHCLNMMSSEYSAVGAATQDCYWTVVFATGN